MLYTDLNKIPLAKFVEVYCGDMDALVINGVHSVQEKKETAERLISRYSSIISVRGVNAEVSNESELLNLNSHIIILESCKMLLDMEEYLSVSEVLEMFGGKYPCDTEEQKKKIAIRVESLLSDNLYRRDKKTAIQEQRKGKKPCKSDFYAELTTVMVHFKMNIDENVVSAEKYANMLKIMIEQMKALQIASKKK